MGNLAWLKQGLCLFNLFSELIYSLLHPEEDKANVKLKGGGAIGALWDSEADLWSFSAHDSPPQIDSYQLLMNADPNQSPLS